MKDTPSELWINAIAMAYQKAKEADCRSVTTSDIWTAICCWAFPQSGMFGHLFEWDSTHHRNRVTTVADTIAGGHVPGLRLGMNAKGKQVVVETEG